MEIIGVSSEDWPQIKECYKTRRAKRPRECGVKFIYMNHYDDHKGLT